MQSTSNDMFAIAFVRQDRAIPMQDRAYLGVDSSDVSFTKDITFLFSLMPNARSRMI